MKKFIKIFRNLNIQRDGYCYPMAFHDVYLLLCMEVLDNMIYSRESKCILERPIGQRPTTRSSTVYNIFDKYGIPHEAQIPNN